MYCNYQGFIGSVRKTKSVSISGTHRKLDQFRALLSSVNAPLIFCVTESKLGPSVADTEIAVDDYTTLGAERNRNGGGVLVYCHPAFRPRRVDLGVKDVEYLCVKIAPGHRRQLQVCCVYSPQKPTAGWKEAFYPMCNVLVSDSSPCVLLGDFNEDLVD